MPQIKVIEVRESSRWRLPALGTQLGRGDLHQDGIVGRLSGGDVKFKREGVWEQGDGNLLKKAITGGGARLTKGEEKGQVRLADFGKKVTIVNLQGEEIVVNGNDLSASV